MKNINKQKGNYDIESKQNKESIDNIDELKKVYFGNYHIEKYMKPIDYSSSIKAIKPLSPIKGDVSKRQIQLDVMNKMIRRNIIESQDIFPSDSLIDSAFELNANNERKKQRKKFTEYQKDLINQIDEKRRRLENEKRLEKDSNSKSESPRKQLKINYDSADVLHSSPNLLIKNHQNDEILIPNNQKNIIKSEEWVKVYPQMMKYFEGMFHSLFQEQTHIIEEYKIEVEILKEELERILNSSRKKEIQSNEMYNNSHNSINSSNNKKEEESQVNILKGALFKSKYEDLPRSSNSLPGSSKMVKKIGERHLLETWGEKNNYHQEHQDNSKSELGKHHIDVKNGLLSMEINDSINDKQCCPIFYIEEEEKNSSMKLQKESINPPYTALNHPQKEANSNREMNDNNNERKSKSAFGYFNSSHNQINQSNNFNKEEDNVNIELIRTNNNNDNMKSISESTYYYPNLPEIDLNQIIDFSKNDSSNIETDSENLVSNGNKNRNTMMQNSNDNLLHTSQNRDRKDSFMTKLTYFDNASQIVHEKIAKSSKQIVNTPRIYCNNKPLDRKRESAENELFDNSLNTINDNFKQSPLENATESYAKEALGTSYSKD